jgi:SAM-dependent methyltransferase
MSENSANPAEASAWGSSFRLTAAERWRKPSGAMGKPATEALVAFAAPKRGMQVLDLASGTGEPAISVAELVGSTGKVVALDQSSDLLEVASRRAAERRLANLETHCADAHRLEFPDASFDLATCRCGVMFFHDVVAALRDLRRVLKPGSRACFLAWGPFEQPYWHTMIGVVLRHAGGPLLPPGGDNPFRFAEPGSLSRVLTEAGFATVEEETRHVPWSWPGTPEDVWEYARAVAAPFKALLERVREEQWPAIHADAMDELRRLYDGTNVDFGATIVLAAGKNS